LLSLILPPVEQLAVLFSSVRDRRSAPLDLDHCIGKMDFCDVSSCQSEEIKRRTKCLLRGGLAGTQEHARKREQPVLQRRNAQKQKAQQHMQQHAISFVKKNWRCAPNPCAATPAHRPTKRKARSNNFSALPRRETPLSSVGKRPSFYFNSLIAAGPTLLRRSSGSKWLESQGRLRIRGVGDVGHGHALFFSSTLSLLVAP